MDWDQIAIRYGTDKASSHHGYMGIYQSLLEHRKVERLFEIGVAHGKSHHMWAEIFPEALIVGCDNEPSCRVHQRTSVDIMIADATDPAKMAAISMLYGPFDVIIDDCTHDERVVIAFDELYYRLAPGGIYIIEDMSGSDPVVQKLMSLFNGEFHPCNDAVGYIKDPGLAVFVKP